MRLALGAIVWVEVPDANGIRKPRPAVIVTPTDRIAENAALDVVAISSRLPDPLPEDHVLPWHAQGHPRTGLNRRCAAICTWTVRVTPADVQSVSGLVPDSIMQAVLAKIHSTDPFQEPMDEPPAVTP